jgi:hypothetical protein
MLVALIQKSAAPTVCEIGNYKADMNITHPWRSIISRSDSTRKTRILAILSLFLVSCTTYQVLAFLLYYCHRDSFRFL